MDEKGYGVPDFLKAIWESSFNLPRQHGLTHSQNRQRRFFGEEALEFLEVSVVESVEGGAAEELAEEAFDVIYTAIGVLQAHGFTYDEFVSLAQKKLAVNNAKTKANGWGVVNGKVKKL